MEILIINGQNHKGSTYKIGKMIAEKITTEDHIKEIFLPRDFSDFCCGCTQCFSKGEKLCPHYLKLKPLTEMIDSADLLIFTSPVYVYHVTGSMKAFLDHYGFRWMVHRPEEKMFQKQAIAIATAAGAGTKSTCKDVLDSCFYWGIGKCYHYGVTVKATKWDDVPDYIKEKIEKKTTEIAKKIKKNKKQVNPRIKTKLLFYLVRMLQKKGRMSPVDRVYWKQKGWLGNNVPWKK